MPNKNDLNKLNDNYWDVPNLKIGKIGLEKKFNQDLLGIPGSATYEVNVFGRRVEQVVQKDGEEGKIVKRA